MLSVDPRVIFLDEPTRGVDVGAKAEIHRILRDLARSGVGIVVISSELPELIGVCDRVLVVREGEITGEVEGDDADRGEHHAPRLGHRAREPGAAATRSDCNDGSGTACRARTGDRRMRRGSMLGRLIRMRETGLILDHPAAVRR